MSQVLAQEAMSPALKERLVVDFMEKNKGQHQKWSSSYYKQACKQIEKETLTLGTQEEFHQALVDVTNLCHQASLQDVIRKGPKACNYKYKELGLHSKAWYWNLRI